mgnify:CR=1 FL=1
MKIINKHFHHITSPSYPRDKARSERLQSLFNIIDSSANYFGIKAVVFEDLFKIKSRSPTRNPNANRKISRFTKREMLIHGALHAMKKKCIVIFVNPSGTTNSKKHEEIMRRLVWIGTQHQHI